MSDKKTYSISSVFQTEDECKFHASKASPLWESVTWEKIDNHPLGSWILKCFGKMIPTPRTDALELSITGWHGLTPKEKEYFKEMRKLERELSASRELCRQFKEVAEELQPYLEHDVPCLTYIYPDTKPDVCNCGLSKAKAKLEALNDHIKICKYDTDGDGNCPIHPHGCLKAIALESIK